MRPTIIRVSIAGLLGTVAMSLVIMVLPLLGLPKMSPPAMLAMMLSLPVWVGWLMHFMIGILFAVLYGYLGRWMSKIASQSLRGLLLGMLAFVVAQLALTGLGSLFPMPAIAGSVTGNLLVSLMGHLVFGITVSAIIGQPGEASF